MTGFGIAYAALAIVCAGASGFRAEVARQALRRPRHRWRTAVNVNVESVVGLTALGAVVGSIGWWILWM